VSALPLNFENTWTATRRASPDVVIELRSLSLRRLLDLLDETEEDTSRVTMYAFKTAYNLIDEAERIASVGVISSPVVDSEGGIRVTWRIGDRQVKLICPAKRDADAPVYIYHASNAGNALRNQNISADVLADRLAWLVNYESAATDCTTE
jgi:hypothetical protein